ncbi:MAG TPA: site-2 protease family protein [Thermoleophilia bacterium]|nr:site-2 protease family protein [Thermoleophilia bacterium]
MSDGDLLLQFAVTLPLLLISLVVHELAHGFVASWLGDQTARREGRLTINPLVQLDTWGTIALVVTFIGSGGSFFFGWAKPVPVDPRNFADPQRGMMLVGAAGPVANFCLALIAAGLVWLTYSWSVFIAQALALAFLLNVVLGVINLLPIPPLDGSRVLGGLLPRSSYARWMDLDRYSNYVFLGLLVVLLAAPQVFESTIGVVLDWSFGLLPGG